jgi:hypothetical protein
MMRSPIRLPFPHCWQPLALPPPPDTTPQAILPRTRLARFTRDTGGVELGVLVQGDGVGCVWGAEDVPAVAAVVFAREERKC